MNDVNNTLMDRICDIQEVTEVNKILSKEERSSVISCIYDGAPVVIKFYNLETPEKEKDYKDLPFHERKADLLRLSHTNLMKIIKFGPDYVVSELCGDKNLNDLIDSKTSLNRLLHYFSQQIDLVKFLSQQGFSLNDIKPCNIMINNGFSVAIDPELFSTNDYSFKKGGNGTLVFSAPEQLFDGEICFTSDVFALGATLYCILYGFSPVESIIGDNVYSPLPIMFAYEDIKCGAKEFKFPKIKGFEKKDQENVKFLLKSALEIDPKRRSPIGYFKTNFRKFFKEYF